MKRRLWLQWKEEPQIEIEEEEEEALVLEWVLVKVVELIWVKVEATHNKEVDKQVKVAKQVKVDKQVKVEATHNKEVAKQVQEENLKVALNLRENIAQTISMEMDK